jgi:hypothetical protein
LAGDLATGEKSPVNDWSCRGQLGLTSGVTLSATAKEYDFFPFSRNSF